MSVLLVTALAVSVPVQAACSWDRPGVNPFVGDVVAAVDRYRDIPADVRATLKARIAQRQFDELATIKRDSIVGAYRYDNLRDMHFGKGTVCRTVTRDRWTDKTQERGLVYCEQDHCLIVPTVCRNVSRVDRVPMQKGAADTLMGPPEGTAFAAASPKGGIDSDGGELKFDAPAAGATPSFLATASGSSSVLPAGSDSGLSSGGDPGLGIFGNPSGSFLTVGGLPPLPVPSVLTAIPGIPPGTDPSGGGGGGGTGGGGGFPGGGGGTVPGGGGVPVTPIPEPSTYALMGVGLALVAWVARRRRRDGQD
ncbi:MAG: MHFG family PEP-CTERM protein [Rubrivivax sp.]|jgi:hypothetical protein